MASKIRIEGETPNGGVASEAYYFDDDGNAVDESEATHMEIVELDKNGNQIGRLYGEVSREPNNA